MLCWVPELVAADHDNPSARDIEYFRQLYAEKHEHLKEEIRRINLRMERNEEKTDELHRENQEQIVSLKEAFGGFKVKLGMIYAGVTSIIVLAAQVFLKKFGLL